MAKQFYIAYYGKQLVTEIVAPIETTLEEARGIMLAEFERCPTIITPSGYAPCEAETMLRCADIKTIPIGGV